MIFWTSDSVSPFAVSSALKTFSLEACTPIFLPFISCGVLMGLAAEETMQNGFFWKVAATVFSFAPCRMTGAVSCGAVMPIHTLFDVRPVSTPVPAPPPVSSSGVPTPAFW